MLGGGIALLYRKDMRLKVENLNTVKCEGSENGMYG